MLGRTKKLLQCFKEVNCSSLSFASSSTTAMLGEYSCICQLQHGMNLTFSSREQKPIFPHQVPPICLDPAGWIPGRTWPPGFQLEIVKIKLVPCTCLQVTFVTGYQEPHLPASVDQLVVDNSVFRIFQDHFVTNTMRADGTLWSLLASISEGWEAIQTTQKNALSHPRFQEFLHNPNCTWDLVIASPFINEAGVMLADHFRAPMILYLPANAGEFLSLSLGHPDSVAWSGAMAGSLGGRINTLLGHMAYELLIKPKYFVQPQAGY